MDEQFRLVFNQHIPELNKILAQPYTNEEFQDEIFSLCENMATEFLLEHGSHLDYEQYFDYVYNYFLEVTVALLQEKYNENFMN